MGGMYCSDQQFNQLATGGGKRASLAKLHCWQLKADWVLIWKVVFLTELEKLGTDDQVLMV